MFKKRTLRMTNLTLGGFSIGVQLYKMLAKAKKSTKTFQVHATTNEELITESALIDQDTGESHHLTHTVACRQIATVLAEQDRQM